MVELMDPGEPADAAQMRAKNLKNLPLILRPTRIGVGEGQDGPYEFVACDVWVLDRSGIVDHGTDVQFAWRRALPQLRELIGCYVACRPVEDGSAVILAPLTGEARDVAQHAVQAIVGSSTDEDERPF